jgi:hypothetical protein
MSKMGSHDPFGHFKHKLWLKEKSWVKGCESGIVLISSHVGGMRHTAGKLLNKGYNFALDLISIGGLHAKLWTPKVTGVQIVGIAGLPLGSHKTKWHLGVGLVARHRVYYKGEGGGFPQVWTMVSLVSLSLLMAYSSTKNARTIH